MSWLDIFAELLVVPVTLLEQSHTQADVVTGLLLIAVQLCLALPGNVSPLGVLEEGRGRRGAQEVVELITHRMKHIAFVICVCTLNYRPLSRETFRGHRSVSHQAEELSPWLSVVAEVLDVVLADTVQLVVETVVLDHLMREGRGSM